MSRSHYPYWIDRRPATPEETAATGAKFIDTIHHHRYTEAERQAWSDNYARSLLRMPGSAQILGGSDEAT